MKLVHTLLLFLRDDRRDEDVSMASKALRSLEKSGSKTVVVYNQGFWEREEAEDFLGRFDLDCVLIGSGENEGIVVGRQKCFEYIWQVLPDTEYISEIHMDMIFTENWDLPLINYLESTDEPVISCGIVDQNGAVSGLKQNLETLPADIEGLRECLNRWKRDLIIPGFTHPCIHKSNIMRAVGGYDARFMSGKQGFEDDSLLLGYYYYLGTKAGWKPKICCKSMVYHAVAGQRLTVSGNTAVNFSGLVKQYGLMGLKHLSELHTSQWHIDFFAENYKWL
ncbi:MAG: hypothetical protein LBB94_13120 [Clostridiales bacterium]|jgi:hypothetical protein|nr:hypothetical protein [Clostridiales bacterium]